MHDVIVINNFYDDPYKIREQALSMAPFPVVNMLPGQRTYGVPDDQSLELKQKFEKILNTPIKTWDTFRGRRGEKNNTCFQLVTENDTNWIHHDDTTWAGVVYLTPDPDPSCGTGLFTHIATGIKEWNPTDPTTDLNDYDDKYDTSKWVCNLEVKNQFNRLILYRGYQYHASMTGGFGVNYLNGRLTQVFFFDV